MSKHTVKGLACVILSSLVVGASCGCEKAAQDVIVSDTTSAIPAETADKPTYARRRIIIDTDAGADDAAAIILAAKIPNVEILGVTVLVGNVDLEQSAKNTLMALETAGCTAPVYKGSEQTLSGEKKEAFSVFGTDGMGDAGIIHPKGAPQEDDAVDFILDSVRENPGEIEIIAIGPATNIARAIEKDPETMKNVKMVWSLGTPGLGHGNASPVAEFNVYADAPAYKVMLDSGIPVTIIGLDCCDKEALWTNDNFEELEKLGAAGEFISASFSKLRDFYKSNGCEAVMNCDPAAVLCALEPGFANETISCHGSCITDEGETYAQVIFYKEGFTYDAAKNDFVYNVTLVTDDDKSDYFETYKRLVF